MQRDLEMPWACHALVGHATPQQQWQMIWAVQTVQASGMDAGGAEAQAMHASAGAATAAWEADVEGGQEDAVVRAHTHGPQQGVGEARAGVGTAPPKEALLVKRPNVSISELLGGMKMPMPVILMCSVDGELHANSQKVGGAGSCMRSL